MELWYSPSIKYLAKYVIYTDKGWSKCDLKSYTTEITDGKSTNIITDQINSKTNIPHEQINNKNEAEKTKGDPDLIKTKVKDWNEASKKLESLGVLLEKKLITKEEYDLKKKELLESY